MKVEEKVKFSIDIIRKYAPLADKYGGYKVAFSGGKDSQVMLDLFRKSGVNYTANYNVTTNDPPENVYFIRKNYPEVKFIHPKLTFLQLIEKKKMLPTINKRFCCINLKEYYGKGFVAVGVRRTESAKRAKYHTVEFASKCDHRLFDEQKMRKNRKVIIRPILEWTEDEIWNYIEDNHLPVNPCYEYNGRVGCMFCPYASTKRLHYVASKYPRYYRNLLRTIQVLIDRGYMREFGTFTAEQVFEWWASKQKAKMYFTQLKLDL